MVPTRAKESKRGEKDGGESERFIVPSNRGNRPEGPGEGRGCRSHGTVGGKHGGCIGTRSRVHETTTDSGTGEAKTARWASPLWPTTSIFVWLTRRIRAPAWTAPSGVDGQTAQDYTANLADNLRSLLDRAKSGTYQAPPVRRAYIPKGGWAKPGRWGFRRSRTRCSNGRSSWSWKPIYEQDFLDCSYGFRPGRSAH